MACQGYKSLFFGAHTYICFHELRHTLAYKHSWMGLHLQISSYSFPLENVTFAIYAKDVCVIPIKYNWENIS